MAQFTGGKFNEDTGVLSYMYGGKGKGKGRGGVSIKEFDDGWFFVDKTGEIRTDVGNGGKLTKTHIDNLNKDKIFDSVPKPDIDAGEVMLPRSVDSNEDTVPLAKRGDLRLSGRDAYDPTNTSSISPNKIGSIDSAKTLERRGMTATLVSVPTPVSESPYVGGPEGLEGVNYEIPQGEFGENYSSVSLPSENFDAPTNQTTYTGPGTSNWSPGTGELSVRGSSTQGNMPMNYSGGNWSPGMSHSGRPSDPAIASAPPSTSGWSDMANANISPTSSFGPPGSDNPNMTSNYSSGWSPDVSHSGMPSEPGIVDKKDDSPWGTAEGWNAAGSVMKGVVDKIIN